MPQMNGHSVLRSHFIPAAEKFHQQSVIARRVLRQLFPMLIRSNSGNHRPADHRQQAHHELVVGGANDSGVKIPVRIRAVLSRPNAVLHRRTALQDLCQFFLRGPAAGQAGRPRFKNFPQLEQISTAPATAPRPKSRNFRSPPPVRKQRCLFPRRTSSTPPGNQHPQCFPQRGAADAQLFRKLQLIGQLVPGCIRFSATMVLYSRSIVC